MPQKRSQLDKKQIAELSRLMAYILRHDNKNEFHVDLDNDCYADINHLVKAIASKAGWHWVKRNHVAEVAAQSRYRGKKRFEIQGNKIRATYRITRKCPSSLVPIGVPEQPAPVKENEWYVILAKQSNLCLDVRGKSIDKGAELIQYDYWGGENQQWKLAPVGDGYCRIIARHSGNCLDVRGMSKDNGATLQQWHYWGGDNQKWKLEPVGGGYFRIIAKHSGMCLDVDGKRGDRRGAHIVQWNCRRGKNQLWKLELAAELDQRTARVWSSKGYNHAYSGKYEEAIMCFDKALAINPKYARVWRDKGYALNHLGRYEDALTCFDEALGLDPTSAHAWSQKGYALLNLNRFEDAIACFEKALDINPHFEEAITYKKDAEEQLVERVILQRGYEILPNNDIRFGIRVINKTEYMIADVETIFDYPRALFSLKDDPIQTLANIPPNGERTATYLLTPLRCIHNESIDALVIYRDHHGKKCTLQMQPKELHCVYPLLSGKPMREGEYIERTGVYDHLAEGLAFSGIKVREMTAFIRKLCWYRLFVVSEYDLEGIQLLYLAGESIGEKSDYLLTAVIQPHKDLTQVAFQVYSNQAHGLHGFLNEITNGIRYLVSSVQSAREIGIIEYNQVINIIDSVVQRTTFATGSEGAPSVTIKDSVVQRTEIKADEAAKRRRREEEELLRREQEGRERLRREEEEQKEQERKAREAQERKKQERLRKEEKEARERRAREKAEKKKREQASLTRRKRPLSGSPWPSRRRR